jgi:phosphonate transport system substrate-binding protein
MMKVTKLMLAGVVAVSAFAGAAQAQENQIEEFRIGLLGGENAQDRLRSNECLREKVEEELGVPTKLFAPADYNGVIEGLLGGNLDMAWLGASGYAKVHLTDPDAVEPVLVKINTDGSYGYHSFGFARRDSGIESLEDAKGAEFAFGDPNSTSGYLIPSIEMPQELGMPVEEFFGDVSFSGGHEQSIIGVYNGDIDVSISWADGLGNWEDGFNSGAFRKAVDAGLVDMTEMVQVWKSNVIPEGPIVVREDLPSRVKLDVVALMASLESMDPECAYGVMAGEIKGMAPIDHSAYTSVVEARRRTIGE